MPRTEFKILQPGSLVLICEIFSAVQTLVAISTRITIGLTSEHVSAMSYSGCIGEQPVVEDSLPVLPIGGCMVNLLETMISENGGITNFDKIRTWNEIETVRKDAKKKKGGWIQRKFVCKGKPSAGGSCPAIKLVGFLKGNIKNKKFRTLQYVERHSCAEFLMKVVETPVKAERKMEKGGGGRGAPQMGAVKKSGPRFQCTFCPKSYLLMQHLKRHGWQKHPGKRPDIVQDRKRKEKVEEDGIIWYKE